MYEFLKGLPRAATQRGASFSSYTICIKFTVYTLLLRLTVNRYCFHICKQPKHVAITTLQFIWMPDEPFFIVVCHNPLRTECWKREVTRFVPHSNKKQLNPIYSISTHFCKQIFTWKPSQPYPASSWIWIFVLHCSTKELNFGAIWLGFKSGKYFSP